MDRRVGDERDSTLEVGKGIEESRRRTGVAGDVGLW